MAIDSYTNLKTEIQNWAARSDSAFVNQIDNFIDMFEAEINLKLRTEDMTAVTTLTTVNGTATVSKPSGFLKVDHIEMATKPKTLKYASKQQVASLNAATESGRPLMWSHYPSDKFIFAPIPDSAYDINLFYYASLTALDDSNTSNWLLVKYPQAYLYGSLKYAKAYIRDVAKKMELDAEVREHVQTLFLSDQTDMDGGVAMQIQTDVGNP